MLLSLLLFTSLWIIRSNSQDVECPMQGHKAHIHHGLHNFVIDSFAGVSFPFAINKCTAVNFRSNNKWYKYMCRYERKGWKIIKTEYSDKKCSRNAKELSDWPTHFNFSNENLGKYYECHGRNSYMALQLNTIRRCREGVTIYAGLNACIDVDEINYYQFYCNNSMGLMQFFNKEATMQSTTDIPLSTALGSTLVTIENDDENEGEVEKICEDDHLCAVWTLNKKCLRSDAFRFSNDSIRIYAKMQECTTEDKDDESSAIRIQLTMSGIITLLLAIYWL
jgi:hypothetical protein